MIRDDVWVCDFRVHWPREAPVDLKIPGTVAIEASTPLQLNEV